MKLKSIFSLLILFAFIIGMSTHAEAQAGSKQRSFYILEYDLLVQEQSATPDYYPVNKSGYAFATMKVTSEQVLEVNLYDQKKQLITTQLYTIKNTKKQQVIQRLDASGKKRSQTLEITEIALLD